MAAELALLLLPPRTLSSRQRSRLARPHAKAWQRPGRHAVAAAATNGASTATATASPKSPTEMDWDNIGFGLTPTTSMYLATCTLDGKWQTGSLRPYGNLELSPSAAVLNYGQGVFEGMKAYRTAKGRVVVFRPDQNAARMATGASRMSMPPPPPELFVDAVKQVVAANLDWIPPFGKGSLYLRPLLFGSGPILGLAPAPDYTLVVFASPVGAYFKGGQLTPISLSVEEAYHRAAPGGTGATKCVGNYSPVLVTQLAAKKTGFSDVLYLDARENKYIEEVSSCNIFVVRGKTIATPELAGTILPGITRRSVCELAASRGYAVEERKVTVDELLTADEVFCTGTAVVLSPVGAVTHRGREVRYHHGEVGPVAQELYTALTDLQLERAPDRFGWVVEVPADYHIARGAGGKSAMPGI